MFTIEGRAVAVILVHIFAIVSYLFGKSIAYDEIEKNKKAKEAKAIKEILEKWKK